MPTTSKFDFVPEVLRDTAARLNGLGYGITYVKKKSDHPGSYTQMHTLYAIDGGTHTKIRIRIHMRSGSKSGLLEMDGSIVIQGHGPSPYSKIRTVDGLWRFAGMRGLCWCGKIAFTEEAADENLRSALLRRVLQHRARRRETRKYHCGYWGGVWHLTSQETYAAVPQISEETQ